MQLSDILQNSLPIVSCDANTSDPIFAGRPSGAERDQKAQVCRSDEWRMKLQMMCEQAISLWEVV